MEQPATDYDGLYMEDSELAFKWYDTLELKSYERNTLGGTMRQLRRLYDTKNELTMPGSTTDYTIHDAKFKNKSFRSTGCTRLSIYCHTSTQHQEIWEMMTRFKKNEKKRGHVSTCHADFGKHRKHPNSRGNAGGMHDKREAGCDKLYLDYTYSYIIHMYSRFDTPMYMDDTNREDMAPYKKVSRRDT
ncbi:hypothetical protein Syun_029741 [Stephania yunnanensis]|uniref:Uncharacterized protein n=1 Tax=Stephania yunnanensis TaxID=152371 RepID=A0AAP0EAM7_9MAGN